MNYMSVSKLLIKRMFFISFQSSVAAKTSLGCKEFLSEFTEAVSREIINAVHL